jgi:DNA-binding LytR/AlgR family response regulator
MINCIVVDDEPLARQLILSYIGQVPGMNCLGEYQSALEAFAALHQNQVDAIFIDIQMPGITGLNFIRSLKAAPKVIFITAYTEYAVDAFEIEAVDYLVKPVTFERFLKTVQKLGAEKNGSIIGDNQTLAAPGIFLKIDRRLVNIDLKSIIYIEGLGDYLKVHTTGKTYVTYMTLNKIVSLLPTPDFIRTHRSTIVNSRFIQFIEGNFIHINDVDLPVGLSYKEGLMKNLRY